MGDDGDNGVDDGEESSAGAGAGDGDGDDDDNGAIDCLCPACCLIRAICATCFVRAICVLCFVFACFVMRIMDYVEPFSAGTFSAKHILRTLKRRHTRQPRRSAETLAIRPEFV